MSLVAGSFLFRFVEIPDGKATIRLGSVDWIHADIADTHMEQVQGLSGRREPQTMLFLFEYPAVQSIWMKEMFFPIDIVWLQDDRVVGIEYDLPPESPAKTIYSSKIPVNRVLEVPAGTVEKSGVKVGERLDIRF